MTICIAALYDNGKGCVLASDQMITAHFPLGYEFESDEVAKMIRVGETIPVYVLTAGDVLFANEVIEKARKEAEAQGITAATGIAELVRKAYQTVRTTTVVHNELQPRGLDMNTYYNSHQRLLPQIVQMIDNALAHYDPRVDLIVAGQGEGICNIYTLVNPGLLTCNDPVGYGTIGSGAPHAMYSLIESGYKKSLDKEKVRNLVERAKKRSEVAPGVGKGITIYEVEMQGRSDV